MSSDGRAKILCAKAGCTDIVGTNSEFCCEHDPATNELKSVICLTPGCTNTADFNDNFLCMVCFQSQKQASRNENERFGGSNNVSDACDTRGCNNHATFMRKCDSCNKQIYDNGFLGTHFSNTRNTSSEESSNDRPSRNQSNPPLRVDLIRNNNFQKIKKTKSNPIISGYTDCEYGNVIPIRNTTMRGRILCTMPGCAMTVSCDGTYCSLHDERTQSIVCINKGCTNTAEFPDRHLCMVCLQEQKNATKEMQYKRTLQPVPSNRPNAVSQSHTTTMFSRLVPDSSTGPVQPGNASFDLKAFAKCLPPIPMPTYQPSSVQERMKQDDDSDIGEVVARGILRRELPRDDLPHMPIPFNSLPPIPMAFSRSNSTPSVTSPHVIQVVNVNAFTPRTPSLDSISPISVCAAVPITQIDTIPSIVLCEKDNSKQTCKAVDCKFFVNEGLDGYCSECFMCFNISDNLPPSPTRGFPLVFPSRIENQFCKSGNCEFFGSDGFDGYCSGCYKQKSMKTDEDITYITDDDDKMCIICLQNVYNTVLLPCGHLYLCYECASVIKNKGKKCPACRSHIQSFHRVYTPD